MGHSYYHRRFFHVLNFIIPPHQSILLYGSADGDLLEKLRPKRAIGIEPELHLYNLARNKFPTKIFYNLPFEKYIPDQKFDFIILNGALGVSQNFMQMLHHVADASTSSTRIIVYQHNHFWEPVLLLLEKLKLKRMEGIHNWLSPQDTTFYMRAAGFERTHYIKTTLSPIAFGGLGKLINWFGKLIPLFDPLKLDQFLIFRPLGMTKKSRSVSICITVRDEEKNIKNMVEKIPTLSPQQEIVFIEGHSKDKTRNEIKKMIKRYPLKNIRLIDQPGLGQADAILTGFSKAKGENIILFEGDDTSDPQDLYFFYTALRDDIFEFIEGSRFVYPLSELSMPFINKIGNVFFAKFFSFILGQHATDILSGIKGIHKKEFMRLAKSWGDLGTPDPFGDFELIFGAVRSGLKIGEIPMRYYPRKYGVSKTRVFYHGWILCKMAWNGYWKLRF